MTAGAAWERQLAAWHLAYRERGLGWVLQTHPAVRVHGPLPGDRFAASWGARGGPDFVGVLASGRAVAFDAKTTAQPRFPLANVAKHQAYDLGAVARYGGVAAIALRCAHGDYWIPWDPEPGGLAERWWAWSRGQHVRGDASVDRDWIYGHGLRIGATGWLACLEGT